MPLHDLQLGPVPPPEGGISRNIFAIREELLGAGHRCSFVATSKSERELEDKDIHYPRTKRELLGLLRSVSFDVLHLHVGGDITPRVLSLAFACTVFAKGKCVLTMHSGGYALSEAGQNAKPTSFAGIVFRRFSRIIAVNEDLAEMFKEFGVAATDLSVVPPFALRPPAEGTRLSKEMQRFCENADPLFVSVGGLEADYEPLLQINAFRKVREKMPNARLIVVGGGSLRGRVEQVVKTETGSIMLAGDIDHDVALALMSRADAVLRITLFDGDAISVREAHYLGTPVIATDNGMRPAGIELVPVGDEAALIAAMAKVTKKSIQTDPPTLAADNSNIRKVIDLYETVVANNSK
jgi:glycosyltransferase involved in cell wall biosynthesis